MTHQLFNPSRAILMTSGLIRPSWKVEFFLTTTTTPTPVYTTSALSTTHTQPVEADAGGVLPAIYLDPSITYKASYYDENDVLQYTDDPVNDNLLSQEAIGELLYPRTAAEITAGVTVVDYSVPSHEKAGVIIPTRYKVNATPGTTDMTEAFEDSVGVASQLGGGIIQPVPADYGITRIELAAGVYIVGTMRGLPYATLADGGRAVRFVALATGEMIGSPGSSNIRNCGVIGCKFYGLGAGTALIGVHFDDVDYGVVRWCAFDNFADQAILEDSDCLAGQYEDNMVLNCLLDRTRAQQDGVIDLGGTDYWLRGGEYTPSLTALTDSNRRVGAIALRGSAGVVEGAIGEFGDFGILITSAVSGTRITGTRADLNWGHGWEIAGSPQMSACLAYRNGRETSNTYDGYYVTGSNVQMGNCLAESLSADTWKHRYGYNDQQNSSANKNYYDAACRSIEHATGAFNFQANAGAAHDTPTGPPKPFADADTTPSVDGYGSFYTANTGATSVTTFDNGFLGQLIEVLADDANTTFVNGSGILTNTGADVAATQNRIYRFRNMFGNWYMY